MGRVGSFLWLLPLLVHVAYTLATYVHFPSVLRAAASPGTSLGMFFFLWVTIVTLANAAFVLLSHFLPRFNDRSFKVPKQAYWLSTAALRKELIDQLRGIIEAALLGLNVFFLAVYQMIYQTNGLQPILSVPLHILVLFFMVAPMVVAFAFMFIGIRGLVRGAEPEGAEPEGADTEGAVSESHSESTKT